ncbi:hypothetical protein [Dyadobacter luticola]|uniref:Uncharacterized protein n=1 Tax=Dyadobacter luticola TaxID=1979387 RepID=A0A5R9KV91_9BACT|nr:hypothetical protein [Dyadobacter luticola]TLU99998.1 hypothetical protein FEN17_10820 [Dyadobacter luticola]
MKTLKLLILTLTLFSYQAGATGYAHNMFVAHRKLQTGKETVTEKVVVKKAKTVVKAKATVQVKQAAFVNVDLTNQAPATSTLNERVLEEGPMSFFDSEKSDDGDESMVTKLVSMVRCVIYTFLGSHLG